MVAQKGFDESTKEVTAEMWLGTAWQMIFMMREVMIAFDDAGLVDLNDEEKIEKLISQSHEFLCRSFKKLTDEDKKIIKGKLGDLLK